jgi:serine/threonine protein kinase
MNLKNLRKKFTELEARLILQQLVKGFKDIFARGVMHRDLKLANILVHFPYHDLSFTDIVDPEKKK